MTPTREAEIKRKKDEKIMRRNQRAGNPFVPQTQWDEQQAVQEQNRKNNMAQHLSAKSFAVPEDVSVTQYRERDPGLWQDLLDGKNVHCTQQDSLYRARVMWFNEIDNKHTFSRYHQQTRMLFSILKSLRNENGKTTELEKAFYGACIERRAMDNFWTPSMPALFISRENFIKLWMESDEDLYIFSRSDLRRYKSMVKDLRAALPEDDERHNSPDAEPVPELSYTDTRKNSPSTAIASAATDSSEPISGAAFNFNSPPATYKPFGERADPHEGIFSLRASAQNQYDPDPDDNEDDGDEDETMACGNLPEVARTWEHIWDEYDAILADGGLWHEKHRERVEKLAQFTRATTVDEDHEKMMEMMASASM